MGGESEKCAEFRRFNEQRMCSMHREPQKVDWQAVARRAVTERDLAENLLMVWLDFAALLARPHLAIHDIEKFIDQQRREHRARIDGRFALARGDAGRAGEGGTDVG